MSASQNMDVMLGPNQCNQIERETHQLKGFFIEFDGDRNREKIFFLGTISRK